MAQDLKEKDLNPAQEDYDKKFNELTSPENYDKDAEEPNLYEAENQPKNDLSNLEEAEKARIRQTAQDDQAEAAGLYEAGATGGGNRSFKGTLKGMFAGKRKWGWIGGGVAGTVIGLILTFFPILGPLHIFNLFFDHNFDLNDSYRRSRTTRILRSVFDSNRTNRDLADTPFKSKIDLVDFERFESRMQTRGWNFEYDANRRPIGLIDPSGNSVDLRNLDQRELQRRIDPLVKDTVPAWQMNKRTRTRILISTFSGPKAPFRWTDLFSRQAREAEPNFNKRKFLKELGLDSPNSRFNSRALDRELVPILNDDGTPVLDEQGNPTFEEVLTENPESSAVDEARQTIINELDDGATKTDAARAGTDVFSSRLNLDANQIGTAAIILSCISYAIYEQDLVGKFERYASALRIGATYMLAANEIQQGGDIDIGEVGQLFNEYNNEDGSFAASAAADRAVGDTVSGEELSPELHVIEQEGEQGTVQTIFESVGYIGSQIPGFGTLCDFVNSALGALAFILLDAVQVVAACVASLCTGAVASFVASEAIFEVIGKLLVASLTVFTGFIVDNPTQAGAFLDQALSLTASEETRTASLVTDAEYNQALALHKQSKNNNLDFGDRYFAMDNPQSLTYKLAQLRSGMTFNPASMLATLFKMPLQGVLAAANSGNIYAQTDMTFENYDLQKYVFDPAYLDTDPYNLAVEVTALIDADTSVAQEPDSVPTSANELARDFAELCMGYNHSSGLVVKGPATTMLPMFSDPDPDGDGETDAASIDEVERKNGLYQVVCIERAFEFKDMYSKVGRFVDDLELSCSIVELTGRDCFTGTQSSSSGGGSFTPPIGNECERYGLGVYSDEVGVLYCVDASSNICTPSNLITDTNGNVRCPNRCEQLNLGVSSDEVGTLYCIDSYDNLCEPAYLVRDPDGRWRCSSFAPPSTPNPLPPGCPIGEVCAL